VVASVKRDERDLESTVRTLQPRETEDGTDLQVAVSGRTNVRLLLSAPLTVPTHHDPLTVVEVNVFADDPRGLVDAVRERVGVSGRPG
jgi:hypothetical protein